MSVNWPITTGWLRVEGASGGYLVQPSLLNQGHLQLVAQDSVCMAFKHLQGWRLHSHSGQPVPVLGHPHSENVFSDTQREAPVFQFVPFASGPVTEHH